MQSGLFQQSKGARDGTFDLGAYHGYLIRKGEARDEYLAVFDRQFGSAVPDMLVGRRYLDFERIRISQVQMEVRLVDRRNTVEPSERCIGSVEITGCLG